MMPSMTPIAPMAPPPKSPTCGVAGMGKLNVAYLMAVFLTSAILGDAVNYAVGSKLGSWALGKGIVKREYVDKTGGCWGMDVGRAGGYGAHMPVRYVGKAGGCWGTSLCTLWLRMREAA